MSVIAAAAEVIADHRRHGRPLAALSDALRPRSVEDGYEIQDAVHAALEPDLGRRIGWKIGCTTKVMQDYLAIGSPCAGGLFSRTTFDREARLGRRDAVRAGIECEIAVRLGRDLDATGAADPDTVAGSIDSYFAAIEIVDDRYESWQTIGTPT